MNSGVEKEREWVNTGYIRFIVTKNGSNERKYQVCINKTFAKGNENKIM